MGTKETANKEDINNAFLPCIFLIVDHTFWCPDFWLLLIHPEGVRSPYLCVVFMLQHYITILPALKSVVRVVLRAQRSWVGDKTALKRFLVPPNTFQKIQNLKFVSEQCDCRKQWWRKYTLEPRSLKMISTSRILPNCCKDTTKTEVKLGVFSFWCFTIRWKIT